MENVIYKPVEDYDDALEPIRDYREQITLMIERMTGVSHEEASKKALAIIKERFKDRDVTFFNRLENGDREVRKIGLASYIHSHNKRGNIIAPSLTTYLPPKVRRSMWGNYTLENVRARAIEKKEAQQAYVTGDIELANYKNNSQNNQKTKNNSLSGLYVSTGSVVSNTSTHSTLTSMTRTMTSITNISNERLVAGNRAYLNPRFAFKGVINEATFCNKSKIKEAISYYNLHIPSVEEVVDIVKRSSDLYGRDQGYFNSYIIPFISKLLPEERAGIAYTTDLYNLWTYNDELMRKIFNNLMLRVEHDKSPMEDPNIINGFDVTVVYFAHNLFSEEIKGIGKDYNKMNETGLARMIYNTCVNIVNYMEQNALFFQAFFMSKIVPINSHRMQYVKRRAVGGSDTDSSMFSSSLASMWLHGNNGVSKESISVSGAITFLSSNNITHQLSMFSKRMNVDLSDLRRLDMKNEWYWTVFVLTDVAKHYYADAAIQEGNVFSKSDLEAKGVHLKSSSIPPELIGKGMDLMVDFLDDIKNGKEMNLENYIKNIINIENLIADSVTKGETKFLRTVNINPASSYRKEPSKSPYRHHMLWEEVFQKDYGVIAEPPYTSIKIPMKLSNVTELNDWLESLDNKEFAKRMGSWITRNRRKDINNIHLEADFLRSNGFPKELVSVVNTEKIIFDLTKNLRMLIATMGVVLDPLRTVRDQFHFD